MKYQDRDWAQDIARFEKFKAMLERAHGPDLRGFIIRQMATIKDRYPQHIREEIPAS